LQACRRRGIGLVDRGGNAMEVEDASESETAETCTDDCHWRCHFVFFSEWNVVPSVSLLEQRSIHVKMAAMEAKTQHIERRTDALTKERIVAAAIEILDAGGEGALTFRALAARLATGSGAIYWHVTDKNELLAAATDDVIAGIMTDVVGAEPREAIRAIALGVFDAIDAHPWVGTRLSHQSGQSATLQIFEGIGSPLQALGVPPLAQFDCWSALVNYILGVAGQNAANARMVAGETDRTAMLAAVAARWAQLDPVKHPFLLQIAAQLPGHDDREQFLAGIDLILAGIATVR
jgi:AcrR family transcriptional regulator